MFILFSIKVTAQLWGNSLGFRIPAPVARETNLSHCSELDLQLESGRIVLTPRSRTKRYKLKTLLAKITPANTPGAEIWGAPTGKEAW
jgi:antitoxin MazE